MCDCLECEYALLDRLRDIVGNDDLMNTVHLLVDDEPKFIDALVTLIRTDPKHAKSDLIYTGAALELRRLIIERARQVWEEMA